MGAWVMIMQVGITYARAGDTLAVVRLDRRAADHRNGVERSRRRAAQPRRENRHVISSWRTDLSRVRLDREFRATFDRRTHEGLIAAARAKGKLPGRRPLDPEKASAALKLVEAGVSPAEAARQLGFGRTTVYREMALAGVRRTA
jgi:DNA invertase Pin-like site-specific DNA recombinase